MFLRKKIVKGLFLLGNLLSSKARQGFSLLLEHGIPKTHLILLGTATTIFITTAFSLVLDRSNEQTEIENDKALAITLPLKNLGSSKEKTAKRQNQITSTSDYIIKAGDNLALIGEKQGISRSAVHLLSISKPHGKLLKNIRPGEKLVFVLDQKNLLSKLIYQPKPLELVTFERDLNSFNSSLSRIEPERDIVFNHGIIQQSLFLSSQKAGLQDALTMRLAQIFQWDIDFVLDIRPGDSFFIMYEELFVENEFIGYGEILAAEFINQDKSYVAILFEDDNGSKDFYNLKGESMRKAFLRAPVEFSRISSSFNLKRRHPLHKTIKAHRGIDYAAPTGTPILAAGDGRIKTASRTRRPEDQKTRRPEIDFKQIVI